MNAVKNNHVYLFYLVTVLFWASLYTYQPTMSPYLDSIGISYTMIGIIGGSYGFVQMILRVPLGLLSDRIGRRKVFVVFGVLIASLSSLTLYIANDPLTILAGRAMSGMAASVWVIFTILFASYFEKKESASRISFLTMYNNSGQVAAMLAGSVVAGYLGYRFPFLLGAIVGAVGLIFSFFIKENVPQRTKPQKIKKLLSVCKDKNLMSMSFLAILSQIVMFGTSITFTPIVAAELNATSEQLGILSMLGNIPRILSAFLCGILLARKIDVKKMLAVSFSLMAMGSFATPFCGNLWFLYGVSIITGFGTGISITTLLSLCISTIDEERRSVAMGFFQAIYGIGMFTGPVAVGAFADGFGILWGFIFSTVVALLGTALSLIIIDMKRSDL